MKRSILCLPLILFSCLSASCSASTEPDKCNQSSAVPTTIKEMIARDWYLANYTHYYYQWKDWVENGINRLPMRYTNVYHKNDACWVERYLGKFGDCYAVILFDHAVEYPVAPSENNGYHLDPTSNLPWRGFGRDYVFWGANDKGCATHSGNTPLLYRDHNFYTPQEAVDFGLVSTTDINLMMSRDITRESVDEAPILQACEKANPLPEDANTSTNRPERKNRDYNAVWTEKYAPEFANSGQTAQIKIIYSQRHGAFFSLIGSVFLMNDPTGMNLFSTSKIYRFPGVPAGAVSFVSEEPGYQYQSPTSYLPVIWEDNELFYPDIVFNKASPLSSPDIVNEINVALQRHLTLDGEQIAY